MGPVPHRDVDAVDFGRTPADLGRPVLHRVCAVPDGPLQRQRPVRPDQFQKTVPVR